MVSEKYKGNPEESGLSRLCASNIGLFNASNGFTRDRGISSKLLFVGCWSVRLGNVDTMFCPGALRSRKNIEIFIGNQMKAVTI
jgi:hypothetical protein